MKVQLESEFSELREFTEFFKTLFWHPSKPKKVLTTFGVI